MGRTGGKFLYYCRQIANLTGHREYPFCISKDVCPILIFIEVTYTCFYKRQRQTFVFSAKNSNLRSL